MTVTGQIYLKVFFFITRADFAIWHQLRVMTKRTVALAALHDLTLCDSKNLQFKQLK